ncbi:hypothetical protein KFE19_08030 [Dysosmobacter sp. Marseille-Q4140]|nr:hypothetical protein KFE19_08030 [Dysosmobacter sp. Marseille-Q4140]
MGDKDNFQKPDTAEDLRAAMEDPEVQAVNQALSRRFLKNNRPKSLAVVIFFVAALLLMLRLSDLSASSVTPSALRTAETVEACLDGASPQVLTDQQREALLDLLDQAKVKRATGTIDTTPSKDSCVFTAGEDQFTLTSDGWLLTEKNTYDILTFTPEEFWSQLETLLAS